MTFSRIIASAGGAGFFPKAPGTVGSLVGLVLGCAILGLAGHWVLLVLAVMATIGGILAIRAAQAKDDPGWVVIDEVAGQWLTLLGLFHVTWIGAIVAFALFRLLDITKPGPIGWADRMHSPTGVMLDDVIAGLIGAVLIRLVLLWHPALFG
ncbi:phosphatidylglycerophosphatase A family protein [Acidisoma silvae]|uniref:Phosphatidylglycerophosphatase A n=1 Tax=Acidisoma silvae TaxID=2802396 RepID=A0A964DX08_9PROT|nr:phosphatidylglycerophosphatase A [Acidisoma silvae]MCB8873765.1 phosphatidylglycerophosphatase A [Acidisoma silvae]